MIQELGAQTMERRESPRWVRNHAQRIMNPSCSYNTEAARGSYLGNKGNWWICILAFRKIGT